MTAASLRLGISDTLYRRRGLLVLLLLVLLLLLLKKKLPSM